VIEGPGITFIDSCLLFEAPRLSATMIIAEKLPLAPGVPLITPELFRLRPGGNDPE